MCSFQNRRQIRSYYLLRTSRNSDNGFRVAIMEKDCTFNYLPLYCSYFQSQADRNPQTGRCFASVPLRHGTIHEKAHEIGRQLADAVTKGQHEYVLTTHIDKGHVHNHIIFCAVNFVDHHKYNSNKRSYYGIRNISDRLCRKNGLSVVVPGKGSKGKSYAEYQAEKTGTSWKGKLKIAVDALIPQVSDFEELLSRLQAMGYEIKPGKYVSCRAPGQARYTRLKILGADYTEEALRERIKGTRTRTAKAPKQQRNGISLLIDIQNSIKAQESRGYEQWAKIHNLKQAAKTMNFLTEHKIEQYADLTAKIAEITAANEQAADSIKAVEKRFADMAVLIKNVTTYQKNKTCL